MARKPRPWFWTQRGEWCVTIEGTRHLLGTDKEAAETEFHRLMLDPNRGVSSESVAAVIDLFLEWTQKHREPRTYMWYRYHLQSFLDHLKPKSLTVDRLKPHHVDSWIENMNGGDSHKRG
ncbi:MAG: hypothetical protein B7Z55_09705, partial [Planctomycetales bacterium 12-60-4]